MRRHLSFRSGNPALTSNTFKNTSSNTLGKMTLEGTINKTALGLLILSSTAYYTFINQITSLIFIGFIGGFILALITIFKKN